MSPRLTYPTSLVLQALSRGFHYGAQRAHRPARRYYSITADGKAMLAAAAERYHVLDQAVPHSRLGLKPSRS